MRGVLQVEFFQNFQAFPTHLQPHKKLILKSRKCLLFSFIYEILIWAIITAMIFGYFSNERIESEIMWCALRVAYKDNSCESHESIFLNPQYIQTLDVIPRRPFTIYQKFRMWQIFTLIKIPQKCVRKFLFFSILACWTTV